MDMIAIEIPLRIGIERRFLKLPPKICRKSITYSF